MSVGSHTTWAYGVRVTQVPGSKARRTTPLLFSGDGHDWREVALPAFEGDSRITAAAVVQGDPDDGWIVGDEVDSLGGILTEHWDGSSWRIVTAPLPATARGGGLLSLSARAADDVWAVGWAEITDSETPTPGKPGGTTVVSHFDALVEHWDGTAWQQTAVPDAAHVNLSSVTALGPRDVMLGGYDGDDQPLILHYDKSGWKSAALPATGLNGEVYQLGRDSDGVLWATGRTLLDPDDRGHALVLRRVGGAWLQVPAPAAAGRLYGFTATPGGITTVGDTTVLRWAAGRWTSLPLPSVPDGVGFWLGGALASHGTLTVFGGTLPASTDIPEPYALTTRL
ncbi:hypothetical protein [Streptomyces sp. NPDC086838]|uniref:hypothetical protein n=1 Tax=Streptomyces sp. NPDC086838 TaxID=3365762 RepID=UPI00382A6A49